MGAESAVGAPVRDIQLPECDKGLGSVIVSPEAPELTLPTDALSLEECVEAAIDYLERHFRSG